MSTRKFLSSDQPNGKLITSLQRSVKGNLPEAYLDATMENISGGFLRTSGAKREYKVFTLKGRLRQDDPSHEEWGSSNSRPADSQRTDSKIFERAMKKNKNDVDLGLVAAHHDDEETVMAGLYSDPNPTDLASINAGNDLYNGIYIAVVTIKGTLQKISKHLTVSFSQTLADHVNAAAIAAGPGADTLSMLINDNDAVVARQGPNVSDAITLFRIEIRKGARNSDAVKFFLKDVRNLLTANAPPAGGQQLGWQIQKADTGDQAVKYQRARVYRLMFAEYYKELVEHQIKSLLLPPLFIFVNPNLVKMSSVKATHKSDTCLFGYFIGTHDLEFTTNWPAKDENSAMVDKRSPTGTMISKTTTFSVVKNTMRQFSEFTSFSRNAMMHLKELSYIAFISGIKGGFSIHTALSNKAPRELAWFNNIQVGANQTGQLVNAGFTYPTLADKATTIQTCIINYCTTLQTLLNQLISGDDVAFPHQSLEAFQDGANNLEKAIATRVMPNAPIQENPMARTVFQVPMIRQLKDDLTKHLLFPKYLVQTKKYFAPNCVDILTSTSWDQVKNSYGIFDKLISLVNVQLGNVVSNILKKMGKEKQKSNIKVKDILSRSEGRRIFAWSLGYERRGITAGLRKHRSRTLPWHICSDFDKGFNMVLGGEKGRSTWNDAYRFFKFNGLDLAAPTIMVGDDYGVFSEYFHAKQSIKNARITATAGDHTVAGMIKSCKKVYDYLKVVREIPNGHSYVPYYGPGNSPKYKAGYIYSRISSATYDIDKDERPTPEDWRVVYRLLHENCGFGIEGSDPSVAILMNLQAGRGVATNSWTKIPKGYSTGVGVGVAFSDVNFIKQPNDIQLAQNTGTRTTPIYFDTRQACTTGDALNDPMFPTPMPWGGIGGRNYDAATMGAFATIINQNFPSLFDDALHPLHEFGFGVGNAHAYNLQIGNRVDTGVNFPCAVPPVLLNYNQGFVSQGVVVGQAAGSFDSLISKFLIVSANTVRVPVAVGAAALAIQLQSTRNAAGLQHGDLDDVMHLVTEASRRAKAMMSASETFRGQADLSDRTGVQIKRFQQPVNARQLPRGQHGMQSGQKFNHYRDLGNKLFRFINFYLMASTNNIPALVTICDLWVSVFGKTQAVGDIRDANGDVIEAGVAYGTAGSSWGAVPVSYATVQVGDAVPVQDEANNQFILNAALFTATTPRDKQILAICLARENGHNLQQPDPVVVAPNLWKNQAKIADNVNLTVMTNQMAAKIDNLITKIKELNSDVVRKPTLGMFYRAIDSAGNVGYSSLADSTAGPNPIWQTLGQNPVNTDSFNQDFKIVRVFLAQVKYMHLPGLPPGPGRVNFTNYPDPNIDVQTLVTAASIDPANNSKPFDTPGGGADWSNIRYKLLHLLYKKLKEYQQDISNALKNMGMTDDGYTLNPLGPNTTYEKFLAGLISYQNTVPKFLAMCHDAGLCMATMTSRFGYVLSVYIPNNGAVAVNTFPREDYAIPALVHAIGGTQYVMDSSYALSDQANGNANHRLKPSPGVGTIANDNFHHAEVCLLSDHQAVTINNDLNPMAMDLRGAGAGHGCAPDQAPLLAYANVACVNPDPIDGAHFGTPQGMLLSGDTDITNLLTKIATRPSNSRPYSLWATGTNMSTVPTNADHCKFGGNNYIVQNNIWSRSVLGIADMYLATLVTNGNRSMSTSELNDNNRMYYFSTVNATLPGSVDGRVAFPEQYSELFGSLRSMKEAGYVDNAAALAGPAIDLLDQGVSGNKFDLAVVAGANEAISARQPFTPRIAQDYQVVNAGNSLNRRDFVMNSSMTGMMTASSTSVGSPFAVNAMTLAAVPIGAYNDNIVAYNGVAQSIWVPRNNPELSISSGAQPVMANDPSGNVLGANPLTTYPFAERNSLLKTIKLSREAFEVRGETGVPNKQAVHSINLFEAKGNKVTIPTLAGGLLQVGQVGGGSSAQFGGSAKLCYGSYVNYFNQLYKTNPKLAKKQMKKLFKKIK